jgi:hypothetical protein
MADGLQVHAQLVRAPAQRLQQQPCGVVCALQDLPARLAGLAELAIDLLQRSTGPVHSQRQIDQPLPRCVSLKLPVHDRDVMLVDLACFKGPTQLPLAVRVARHEQQTRGGHVEPVHRQGAGPARLHPRAHAVLLVRSAAGHGQHTGGLVEYQQIRVLVDQALLDAGRA